jgi:hypothetical protein
MGFGESTIPFEGVGYVGWVVNTWIVKAAKALVQLKNLFWIKDCWRPCLDNANTTQPILGRLLQAVSHLYS